MSNSLKEPKKPIRQDEDIIEVNHNDAILRTFILFVQTAREVMKCTDICLYRKARFSIVKLIVLRVLASNGGRMKPYEIANWTQTDQHNVTTLINRMKRDGLVKTERDGSDRRYVNVTLTNKGLEALSAIIPAARECVDQMMSSISEGDAVLLEKLLKVLRRNAHNRLNYIAEQASPQPESD